MCDSGVWTTVRGGRHWPQVQNLKEHRNKYSSAIIFQNSVIDKISNKEKQAELLMFVLQPGITMPRGQLFPSSPRPGTAPRTSPSRRVDASGRSSQTDWATWVGVMYSHFFQL